MNKIIRLEEIQVRNTLKPGDIGYITYLHGSIYSREYNYGIAFETYVAEGLLEFYNNYNKNKDRVWICEHNGEIVGSLLLMNRNEETAQLRYFILKSEYRGIGLGKKLMQLFMDFMRRCRYNCAYLWTTTELHAALFVYPVWFQTYRSKGIIFIRQKCFGTKI